MKGVWTAARRYPLVAGTVLDAAVCAVLSALGWSALVPWLLGGYALFVAALSAWDMVQDLRRGILGVDLLALTAICASVAVGEYWAALVIVLMLTGGEALEDFAAERAKRDLTALLDRSPHAAHRRDASGAWADVAVDELRPGDRILVRAAEVVPADGVLVSATGSFDESSLTGESLPVERTAGDEVPSGGVNGSSAVELDVVREPRESQYQRIIALVEEASKSRSPIVRLADRYAVPFTAVAFLIAGLAWWLGGNPHRFAEVLVVATPCPLIIAAPVAFLAGMSRSAKAGAILKGSGVLELLARARSFAFDKTGTLTSGAPVVARFEAVGDAVEALGLAASAEQASTHVLARAIVGYAEAQGVGLSPVASSEETTAAGVAADVAGHRVVVGKAGFVAAAVGAFAPLALEAGELAVHVGVDGSYRGAFVLRDDIRADAATTVAELRASGVDVEMLTGDDEATAAHVAEQLGIEHVRANCLPADKVEAIRRLPRPVVMVGDGVNDAPVLAAADVGVAMGARGATAASEAADVVILRDDLARILRARRIGAQTIAVAMQSIGAGIGLSVALMVVAAFGVLPAIWGAWCQEAVDAVSILWALRALRDRA